MYEYLLQKIGLSENEAKVYLSLLKIGNSSTSKIVSTAGISGGKIYETLDKLYQKGFVSISNINGIKHFQATNPDSLILFIEEQKKALSEKQEEIKKILPEISKIQKEETFTSEIIIGERGIKPLVQKLFENSKKTIFAMGIDGEKKDKYNYFWWHLTYNYIEKINKKAKYLFVENTSKYYKKHLNLKNIESKTLKNISPSAIDIIDNHILIFTYDNEKLHCVHIESEPIARSFKSFFDNLWQQSN